MYISIPVLAWLSVFDWKSRRVSNWLTLPVLGVALVVRAASYGIGDWRIVLFFAALVLLGWAIHLVGGADVKASLAMALLDPRLAAWAWAGGVLWLVLNRIALRRRESASSYPGFIGFAAGVFVNMCVSLYIQEAG
jgi:prepilin signal peptidase PulO-like enzyme (type II secretory pathway)